MPTEPTLATLEAERRLCITVVTTQLEVDYLTEEDWQNDKPHYVKVWFYDARGSAVGRFRVHYSNIAGLATGPWYYAEGGRRRVFVAKAEYSGATLLGFEVSMFGYYLNLSNRQRRKRARRLTHRLTPEDQTKLIRAINSEVANKHQ